MPAPANLVHELSVSTGTGNFTLTAQNGKQRFSTAFGTGATPNVFDYFISNQDAAEWERGTGHMSAVGTLVRDTVLESTNANAAANFSTGTKDVTNDVPAVNRVRVENTGIIPLPSGASISWNSGDVTITHSADALAFAGAANGYSFDQNIKLAATKAIDFGAGDVTITHSTNALAFGGAANGYSFDQKLTAPQFDLTGAGGDLIAGPTTPVAGVTAATDWMWGTAAARTALTAEAGIWAAKVFNGVGIAKQFTSANNSAVANQGPNNALFVYAENAGVNNDVVAVMGDVYVTAANVTGFGANFIARNNAGINGVKLVGCELDVEFAAGTTPGAGSGGLYINAFNVAIPGPAIQVGGLSGGTFQNGITLTGLHPTTAAGLAPNGAASMDSLVNTGLGVFNSAAVILSNTHRVRFNGTAAAHGYIFNDAGNALRIVGGSAGTAYRDNADANTNLFIADGGDADFRGAIRSSGPLNGIGYQVGAGGSVTQITSKITGVTLNKVCGQIVMSGVGAIAAGASVLFILTNSTIAALDLVHAVMAPGGTLNAYTVSAVAVAAGSCGFRVTNITAGPLTEAPVINFTITRSVIT